MNELLSDIVAKNGLKIAELKATLARSEAHLDNAANQRLELSDIKLKAKSKGSFTHRIDRTMDVLWDRIDRLRNQNMSIRGSIKIMQRESRIALTLIPTLAWAMHINRMWAKQRIKYLPPKKSLRERNSKWLLMYRGVSHQVWRAIERSGFKLKSPCTWEKPGHPITFRFFNHEHDYDLAVLEIQKA